MGQPLIVSERTRKYASAQVVAALLFLAVIAAASLYTFIESKLVQSRALGSGVIVHAPLGEKGTLPAYQRMAGPGVILLSSDDPQAEMIVRQVRWLDGSRASLQVPYGVFQTGPKKYTTKHGDKELLGAVAQIQKQRALAARPRSPFILGLVGFALGLLLRRGIGISAPVWPAVAALIAIWLARTRCETCAITDSLFGVDIALIGVVCFGAVAVVSLLCDPDVSNLIVTSCFFLSTTVQCILFARADHFCAYCTAIFSVGALYVGSGALPSREASQSRQLRRWPIFIATCLLLCSMAVGFVGRTVVKERRGQTMSGHIETQHRHLKGLTISSLGITHLDGVGNLRPPLVLVVGSETCDACLFAREWLSRQTLFDGRFVLGPPGVRPNISRAQYWLGANSPTLPTPTLIAVGADGKIIDEFYGWNNAADFQMALTQRFSVALRAPKH